MATPKSSRRKKGRAGHHRLGFNHFNADFLQFKLDTGVVDFLVSRLVLTNEDADKIRQTTGQTDRNKCLLSILKDRPYNTFSIFTEALNKAEDPIYNDLVSAMKTFETNEDQPHIRFADKNIEIEDFCVRFQKSYKTLVDQISSPMKIADILLGLEALTIEDYEDISSLPTVFQKNRMLLSKVAYKGKFGYESFLRALQTSDDCLDQELASEVERTEISQDDRLLFKIGVTLSHENKNISSNIREFETQFEDYWIEEDAAFVETKGTMTVLNKIKASDCVTIVGNSGSGKTAVMRHVVLKLKNEQRLQVIHVDSPKEILKHRVGDANQIFLIDDVLGTYAVSPILITKWEKLDKQIQHCLNMNPGNMKLLCTSRKQVVNNKIFSNCSSIITQNIVDLEDNEIALSKEEKKQILTKHLKMKDMEGSITENDVEEACVSDYAFPLLCRIVSSNVERLKNIAKFFREPFSVLEEELRKLSETSKEVYCSLVFCMLFNGKIGKDFFDVNLPKHDWFSIVAEACGLDRNVSRRVIEDGLNTVIGTYVSSENGSISFMHDAFQESISSNFAKLNPDVMFRFCDIDLIRDRVRINSGLRDDDENVIVIGQDQFKVIAKRILTECEAGRFSNLLLSQLVKSEDFMYYLGTQTSINTLMMNVSEEKNNNSLKDSLLEMLHNSTITDIKKNKLDGNDSCIKQVINAPSRQSTFIHWVLAVGCYRLFSYFWGNASKKLQNKLLSRDWISPLTKPFFSLAVLGGNVDIIRALHSSGASVNCFSSEGETPLSLTFKSGRHDIAAVLIDLGADVNQPDMFSHRFPSFICVKNENVEVLELLLNNNCDVNLVDIYGRNSTMLQALLTRKRNIVNVLLEFDSKDHSLHAAILNGDVDCLKTNLGNEDINSQTINGFTPLHYATLVNGTIMIGLLLDHHPDVQSSEQLMITGRSQEIPSSNSMVANINSKNKNGLTPLHLAVLNDHAEAVKLLVQKHSDVNVKDQFGRMPLHYSQISAISSLLLNRESPRSIVAYSAQSGSLVPENQSDVVIDNVDGDQGDRRTLSWCDVFRNVAWYFLPLKTCIYGGKINQPDNHGNTPLHVVVDTSRDLHPNLKENCDSASNIKLLLKYGANIHLRNDEGNSPSDLVRERNGLRVLLTFYTPRINRIRQRVVEFVLLTFSLICCFALVTSPLAWTLSNIRHEYNFVNDSNNSNQTNMNAFKRRADDVMMYHIFLTGVMLYILNSVVIIRIVIQLWKEKCRYRIPCFIMLPTMMLCGVMLLIVQIRSKYKRTTFAQFWHVLSTWILSCHLIFAISIKTLISLEMKRLQTILFMNVLPSLILPVIFILVTSVEEFLSEKTTSTVNKTVSYILQNGSLTGQVTDFINRTTFQPCTSLNSTKNLSVAKNDFTSCYHTLLYIIFISITVFIFNVVCEKSPIQLSKRNICKNRITLNYYKSLAVMNIFILFFVLCLMIMYYVKHEEFGLQFIWVDLNRSTLNITL